MKVFGPVPSRRLGKSIGINNIPPKICSYSCSYCQLGKSLQMQVERQPFYSPKELVQEVKSKIKLAIENHEKIDYLTIVPDGEPTLDANLGTLIQLLKTLPYKVAVITNSSLLDQPQVQRDLYDADWVSVKVDSVHEKIWKQIDCPVRTLKLDSILEGIQRFASYYEGILVTETMLVQGCNDNEEEAEANAAFIASIQPAISYISIPTRPPADKAVKAPTEEAINAVYQCYQNAGLTVEYLIGYEGNEFAFTGNVQDDVLSITSVHPMREDAIHEYLLKSNADYSLIQELLDQKKLVVKEFNGRKFYIRALKKQ